MQYQGLTEAEKLAIAQDRLRDMEADHFRLYMTDDPEDEPRLEKLEQKITTAQQMIETLTQSAAAEKAAGDTTPAAQSDTRTEL